MALLTLPRGAAVRRLAAAIALAVGVSVMTGVSAPAMAGAGYQQPKTGSCHKLTYRQVMSEAAPLKTVRCQSRGVTTVTVKTGLIPSGIAANDYEAAWDAVGEACISAHYDRIGRTAKKRYMSAFGITFLLPTAKQRAQGAHWYRCDAFLWRANDVSTLKRTTKPLLGARVPDHQRLCLTRGFYSTTCDAAHMWRITAAVKLGGTSYPADMRSAANAACAGKITTSKGRLLYPSEDQWAAGFRFVRCFNKQKKGTGGLAKVVGRSAAPGVLGREVGVVSNP